MKLTSLGSSLGLAIAGIITVGSIDRATAVTITLYDGASAVTPNFYNVTNPPNPPNPYLTFLNFEGGSQAASGGVTTLDTTAANSAYAGYSNYNAPPLSDAPLFSSALTSKVNSAFPILDTNAGYTLSFRIKINAQVNDGTNGANRAGFSAIVLGNDNKGIELGFRNDDIFSQGNATFDTFGDRVTGISNLLSDFNTYNLIVQGNNYTLTSGSTTLINNGLLEDYTTATGFASGVYRTPNFIFLGDDTTSARASVDIQSITLTTNSTAVPEPSDAIGTLFALGLGGMLKRKLNRAKFQKIGRVK